jgi:hypothetical protein
MNRKKEDDDDSVYSMDSFVAEYPPDSYEIMDAADQEAQALIIQQQNSYFSPSSQSEASHNNNNNNSFHTKPQQHQQQQQQHHETIETGAIAPRHLRTASLDVQTIGSDSVPPIKPQHPFFASYNTNFEDSDLSDGSLVFQTVVEVPPHPQSQSQTQSTTTTTTAFAFSPHRDYRDRLASFDSVGSSGSLRFLSPAHPKQQQHPHSPQQQQRPKQMVQPDPSLLPYHERRKLMKQRQQKEQAAPPEHQQHQQHNNNNNNNNNNNYRGPQMTMPRSPQGDMGFFQPPPHHFNYPPYPGMPMMPPPPNFPMLPPHPGAHPGAMPRPGGGAMQPLYYPYPVPMPGQQQQQQQQQPPYPYPQHPHHHASAPLPAAAAAAAHNSNSNNTTANSSSRPPVGQKPPPLAKGQPPFQQPSPPPPPHSRPPIPYSTSSFDSSSAEDRRRLKEPPPPPPPVYASPPMPITKITTTQNKHTQPVHVRGESTGSVSSLGSQDQDAGRRPFFWSKPKQLEQQPVKTVDDYHRKNQAFLSTVTRTSPQNSPVVSGRKQSQRYVEYELLRCVVKELSRCVV